MKCLFYFISLHLITAAEVPKDVCDSCAPTQKCPLFKNLNKQEQDSWLEKFRCNNPQHDGIGRSATTEDVYVCCSNYVWTFENPEQLGTPATHESSGSFINKDSLVNQGGGNENTNNKNEIERVLNHENSPDINLDSNKDTTNYLVAGKVYARSINGNKWTNNRNTYWNDRPSRQWNNEYQNTDSNRNIQSFFNYKTTQRPSVGINQPGPPYNDYHIYNNQRTDRNRNDFYGQNQTPSRSFFPGSNNKNNNQDNRGTGQCDHLTSFPPDPRSGCCGREASDSDRITGSPARPTIAPPNIHRWGQPPQQSWRQKREDDGNNVTVQIESRISGGKATELYQYPWTVLLFTSFNFGNRQQEFNCGGSLISAKYVLTAGHCVYEKGATVTSVVIHLAEYDKRTFPRDCKFSQSGKKCIENIVVNAEYFIIHPQFDNQQLLNDIALIRLQGTAPYTEYIRPICLPTINVDEPRFSDLQFEVAGWGRTGQYTSDVKQSTVMHLVNQNKCKMYYPMLTTKHLCAAGYKGQDTCKGDSGGPLMTLYGGRYYATGVVSGKRADSPCGSAVPSLYTNVYHYIGWIRSNIKN